MVAIMLDQESTQVLQELKDQLTRIEKGVKATRSYMFWTFVVTIIFFVLPIVGLVFVIPVFISTYASLGSLGI